MIDLASVVGSALALDFENATIVRYWKSSGEATVVQRSYTHQVLMHVMVMEVAVHNPGDTLITIK